MVMILMNARVRDRAPDPPASSEQVEEVLRRGPGRPKGSSAPSVAKVMREEVAGIKKEMFPHLPPELWNRLTAGVSDYVKHVATSLNEAYSTGIEAKVVEILDVTLPDAALALGRDSMEAFAAQERGFRGSCICCHEDGCTGVLEYQGDVAKSKVKTRIGMIDLKRAYYHGSCGHSVSPLDRLIGLDGTHDVMPSLQDTVAWLAASMSFPETVKVLDTFCPSKFSLKAVETITATIAAQVQEAQQEEIQAVEDDPSAAARRDGDLVPGVVCVGTDGGFISVRDHTHPTKEFKLAVLGSLCPVDFKPQERVAEDEDEREKVKLLEKSYVGHFAGPETLYRHVMTEFFRRGYHKVQTLHGFGDGGCWVLPRIKDLLQEGQELSLVLDWWHAKERIGEVAVLHGHGTTDTSEWKTAARSALWDGRLDDFFASLSKTIADAEARADSESQKALQGYYEYFDKRRHLLRYRECRERGLPIGSGAIEGGIKFIGKDRLDGSGMRWNIAGGEKILQLRSVKYSDRWDELAKKRSDKRRQRYDNARTLWDKAA